MRQEMPKEDSESEEQLFEAALSDFIAQQPVFGLQPQDVTVGKGAKVEPVHEMTQKAPMRSDSEGECVEGEL